MISDRDRMYRAMDANANRCVEGMRAAEDGLRFVLDDAAVTAELRALRRLVRDAVAGLPGGAQQLLLARDSACDVARNAPSAPHADARAMIFANLKRAQEAARSLEEFARAAAPELSAKFGEARFRLYDAEKRIGGLLSAPARPALPCAPFLYAVADFQTFRGDGSFAYLEALLDAGVPAIQLREKHATDRLLAEQAAELARRMQSAGSLLFVNDRVDVALAAGAHGVHLGQDDISVRAARAIAGDRLLIGVSTNIMSEAEEAAAQAPDYLSAGAVFASPTKPERPAVGVEFAAAVARAFPIPVVAIGGITERNAAQVAAAGAAGAAVISDLARAADPRAQALTIMAILKSNYRAPAQEEDNRA